MNNPDLLVAIYQYGNLTEALVWFGFCLRFLIKSTRSCRRNRLDQCQRDRWTAFAFFAFGCSDLVEMQTFAWWRPWWLLLWKVSGAIALLGLLLQQYFTTHVRAARQAKSSPLGSLS
ncbi:MAG: hypothetical protein ACO3NK_16445, partial [Prochlorotrichaceae cyanobacterium]